jgi:hypothetical protein
MDSNLSNSCPVCGGSIVSPAQGSLQSAVEENPCRVIFRRAFELLPSCRSPSSFRREVVAIGPRRQKIRPQTPTRYCTHSSESTSPSAENFRYAVSSARISCSATSRWFISFLGDRLHGENPTLKWRASSSRRLALSVFFTRLTPDQRVQPWPKLLIIFILKRRPLNYALLAIDGK